MTTMDTKPTPLPERKPANLSNAEKIRRKINVFTRRAGVDGAVELNRGEKGAIVGNINRIAGDSYTRKRILAYLFSRSSEDSSGVEYRAVRRGCRILHCANRSTVKSSTGCTVVSFPRRRSFQKV